MRILAILTPGARRRLQLAVPSGCQLLSDDGAAAAIQALMQRGCDALVLDPSLLADDLHAHVLSAIAVATVPVLLYAPLTALGARRTLQIEELGPHELILRGLDDDLELLRRRIAGLFAPSVPAVLFSNAASRFRCFPEGLQTASMSLFGNGPVPRWVDELAANATLTRRSVDRWMHRAGIRGASMLLDVARLARAWDPLARLRESPADVALALGYSRLRLFVAHTYRIVGVPPVQLAGHLSRAEFTRRLTTSLLER